MLMAGFLHLCCK